MPGTCTRMRLEPSRTDRKSTRLNSSHLGISYAVLCLKKKNTAAHTHRRFRPLHELPHQKNAEPRAAQPRQTVPLKGLQIWHLTCGSDPDRLDECTDHR